MKLSTKFILFIIVIHAVTIALSFYIFRENKLIFIASEFFILISLMICWSLYSELIAPLNLLVTGIEALHDKDFNVKFIQTGKYEMDELIKVYNTMIDQLRTERTTQQEQYYFLDTLIQNSPIGIIILDFDEKITSLNPKALAFLDNRKQDLIGQSIHTVDNLFFKTITQLKKNESATLNTEGVKKYKIQKVDFIDRGFSRSCVMIEELTMEILEAEKHAYGKVIRMMAHEVNNSIGAVNSILDTSFQMEQDAEVANALKIAIERNDHLNHFMRNFADIIRLPEPHKETLDLRILLKNVAALMEYKAKEKHIRFEFVEKGEKLQNTEGGTFQIKADVEQVEQVLINIVKNAIEAIDNQGIIRFEIYAQSKQLWIHDTGKGIPHALEQNLFSPFFTNKNGGQGIGLTLTREILTKHGFGFSLQNKEGGGAIFKVMF
jgi:two-component system, NtrC family, nitrogen regulation sensor histidine kinase NtrY